MRPAILHLLSLVAVGSAAAQPEVRTSRLALRFDEAGGGFELSVFDHSGAPAGGVEGIGLVLDGQLQRGFRTVGTAPLVLESERARLTIEPASESAIALTWESKSGGLHEFDLRIRSSDETAYYGTGERFNALNQRGYLLPISSDDRYGNKGVGTHKPIPFVMSTDGFGLWVDTYAAGAFDLSATERFVTSFRFEEERLRAVFLAGPSLAETLESFTGLTGRTRVPPPWAFGLWKSRDVHHNRDSVMVDVDLLRSHGIPASVLVLDSPWATGYNDFVVNRTQFSDPESMFRRVRERGFVLSLWLTPFVNVRNVQDAMGIDERTSMFDEAAAAGYLVMDSTGAVALSDWWKGTGGLVDFTNPTAVDWWFGLLDRTLPTGARAFKCDDGEGNFVPAARFHDGTPARLMRNRYAALYDSVMQAYVDDRLGGDGVLLTRSGHTGSQRYPFDWAGDNRGDFSFEDGLPSVVLAGQNAAMSGIPLWGSDIAGYAGPPPTPEVFIRWTQASALSPFMQVHMTSNRGPWDFGPEALEIFRRYARLRTALFPYLYEAVHEASRTGMPVIRPMALAFEGDPLAPRQRYQYLFGPDLLVAPVIQPGTHRSVYLPAGEWVDFWSGERYQGPTTLEVEAPLWKLPLFVRAGAILPALPDDVQTLVERHEAMDEDIVALDDRRVLLVWPGGGGSVTTWDGLSADLEAGGGRGLLTVASDRERPLEIRLLYRDAEVDPPAGAAVRLETDPLQTIVTWQAAPGTVTLSWDEPDDG